jgi:hypothetical protein
MDQVTKILGEHADRIVRTDTRRNGYALSVHFESDDISGYEGMEYEVAKDGIIDPIVVALSPVPEIKEVGVFYQGKDQWTLEVVFKTS